MSFYGIVWRLIRVEVTWWLSLSRLCLVGFRKNNNGKKQEREKKKSRSTVRQFYICYVCFKHAPISSLFESIFFYALDMINIFPSANVPGHLKDSAVQGGQPAGLYQTDFEIDL